jgi:hypothetical protein
MAPAYHHHHCHDDYHYHYHHHHHHWSTARRSPAWQTARGLEHGVRPPAAVATPSHRRWQAGQQGEPWAPLHARAVGGAGPGLGPRGPSAPPAAPSAPRPRPGPGPALGQGAAAAAPGTRGPPRTTTRQRWAGAGPRAPQVPPWGLHPCRCRWARRAGLGRRCQGRRPPPNLRHVCPRHTHTSGQCRAWRGEGGGRVGWRRRRRTNQGGAGPPAGQAQRCNKGNGRARR